MTGFVLIGLFPLVLMFVYSLQRKVPDQDVAQGSYIALPLTLLLLLAAYNHEKVRNTLFFLKSFPCSTIKFGIFLVGINLTGIWPYHA